MNALDNRPVLYDPQNGLAVFLPAENELPKLLHASDPETRRACVLLWTILDLPGDDYLAMPVSERERMLRRRMRAVVKTHAPTSASKAQKAKLKAERLAEVKRLLGKGLRQFEIAEKLGLSRPYVCQLLKGA